MNPSADFLIIGSGIAGLRAAVALGGSGRVLILTKAAPEEGSTVYAQGGIAAALGSGDSPELHAADTIAAGDGLCDERAVDVLVEDGARRVRELIEWGAGFDRDEHGQLALAREGAHSVRRVFHARDATGREISRVLAARLATTPDIIVRDHTLAVAALIEDQRCVGVRILDEHGQLREARARSTLLATGGAGQVYRETSNPPVASGDGISLAYRAGASIADVEFVQFHPTVLDVGGAPRSLLSEALRGEGAHLVNESGERFMLHEDPAAELAPRDRVARAIVLEAQRTGGRVYLMLAHLPAEFVRTRFPVAAEICRRAGLDLATDRIPVGPAAHYLMGGVSTDLLGRTSIPGLFAAGEVAATGVHGANRLASNSLLEGLVFGARAGEAMRDWSDVGWPVPVTRVCPDPAPAGAALALPSTETEIRDLMWNDVGVFRHREGLSRALARLEPAWEAAAEGLSHGRSLDTDGWRLLNLITVGRLIARAAVRREESRGAHSRTDYPHRDDIHWKRHLLETRRLD